MDWHFIAEMFIAFFAALVAFDQWQRLLAKLVAERAKNRSEG